MLQFVGAIFWWSLLIAVVFILIRPTLCAL
jgi:hypothetical protein